MIRLSSVVITRFSTSIVMIRLGSIEISVKWLVQGTSSEANQVG